MADAYTGIGAIDYDQAAWNKEVWFAFRENTIYDAFATVKAEHVTNPGATVTFFKQLDLPVQSATLNESVDVDAIALDTDVVTVSLYEKGAAVISTQLARLITMIPLDRPTANVLGQNAADSIDAIVSTELYAGTNVSYSNSVAARVNLTGLAATSLNSKDFRYARNRLRRNKVPKINGRYVSVLHPDALYDLRAETGGIGWRDAMIGGSETGITKLFTDEIGMYEGFSTIENANAPILTNLGSGSVVDVYPTLFMGERALAKGYSSVEGYGPQPITVIRPPIDKLLRFPSYGWKHYVGYKRFEESAIYRIESSSTIGANAS